MSSCLEFKNLLARAECFVESSKSLSSVLAGPPVWRRQHQLNLKDTWATSCIIAPTQGITHGRGVIHEGQIDHQSAQSGATLMKPRSNKNKREGERVGSGERRERRGECLYIKACGLEVVISLFQEKNAGTILCATNQTNPILAPLVQLVRFAPNQMNSCILDIAT